VVEHREKRDAVGIGRTRGRSEGGKAHVVLDDAKARVVVLASGKRNALREG